MNAKSVELTAGNGGLPMVKIRTPWSTAEIYLHGAHLTAFQKNGEPPLLFTSRQSLFAPGKAIRGGVPICFPWFGARPGAVMHGLARITDWKLEATTVAEDGGVKLVFRLPESTWVAAGWPPAKVDFIVTVRDTLTMELLVANTSAQDFVFEGCLHTYFAVGDIAQVSLAGLKGLDYLDKVQDFARKQETAEVVTVSSEVDRVYLDATGTVEIHDARWHRVISVAKSGSASTVVWNPWVDKAKGMADFGDTEYREMICVESGNVGDRKLTLPPGGSSSLKVTLGSVPWP